MSVCLCVCVCVCADVSCTCPAGYVGNGDFCNGVLSSVLATNRNFSIFYKVSVTVAPFSVNATKLYIYTTDPLLSPCLWIFVTEFVAVIQEL